MKDKDRHEILFEQILLENRAIRESLSGVHSELKTVRRDVNGLKVDLHDQRTDLREMKSNLYSLTEESPLIRQIALDHETRITTLETDHQAA